MTFTFSAGQVPTADELNELITGLAHRTTSATSRPSSTTYTDDDVLTLPVVAGATYQATLSLLYAATTTADFKIRLTLPTGATTPNWSYVENTPAIDNWTPTTGRTVPGEGAAAISGFYTSGVIVMSSTAGDATWQWAQAVSEASNCQAIVGSYFSLVRVA